MIAFGQQLRMARATPPQASSLLRVGRTKNGAFAMRIMWLDRLDEMLAEVSESGSIPWHSGTIQKLFRVRVSTARKIMIAVGRVSLPGNKERFVEAETLRDFLEAFSAHLKAPREAGVPRSQTVRTADDLFREILAEAEEAKKLEPAGHKLTVITIDPKFGGLLKRAQRKLGKSRQQVVEEAIAASLAALDTAEQYTERIPEFAEGVSTTNRAHHRASTRSSKTKKAPSSQATDQVSLFESSAS